MSLSAETLAEPSSEPRAAVAAALAKTRPFYWSVRRELWESRSIYIAPLITAGVVLFACLLGAPHILDQVRALPAGNPEASMHLAIALAPIVIASFAIIATVVIVGVFYCLGALQNDRRDRSILFWKSLPVSDLITVLAKASMPLVVLPIVALTIIAATTALILALSFAFLLAYGQSLKPLLDALPGFSDLALTLPYVLGVLTLWYAPVAGWLLLVSGWAHRAPFLWAVLPPLAGALIEKLAFGTDRIWQILAYRLSGGLDEAFAAPTAPGSLSFHCEGFRCTSTRGIHAAPMDLLDPLKFVTCPDLWVGLAFAAAFIGAAVWMRRYREPI